MAGIGFELRKIFHKKSVFSKIKGVMFASMTTIGPTVVFALLLVAMNLVMQYFAVPLKQQVFFSSACLYVFVMATMVSAILNTISARFTADRIYEEQEEYIPSAMYGTLCLAMFASAAFGLAVCALLYLRFQVPLSFLAGYYMLGIMAAVTYTVMTFISAIKEYAKITGSYVTGILLCCALFPALHLWLGLDVVLCMLYSLTFGFLVINVLMIYYVLSYFRKSNQKYFAFFAYYRRYPLLFLSGMFYIAGLYVPNILYWFFSDIAETVTVFHVAPSYDMAMFLAILVNLSATVIFVVKVETQVFEKYQKYVTAVNNASFGVIEKNRVLMSDTISVQLFFVYEMQLIIVVLLCCLSIFLFPMIGMGGLVLDFFLLLGIGFYSIFSMYFTVVMLYYFDDQRGSCMTTALFFGVSTAAALAAIRLGPGFYAMAPFIGSITAWFAGFQRLKYDLTHINEQLFCKTAGFDTEGWKT